MPPFELRVSSLGGEVCRLTVDADWWARDVKAAIARVSGIPTHDQRLVLADVELHDEDPLGEAPCEEGLDIVILRRPPLQAEWLSRVEANWQALRDAPEAVLFDSEVVRTAIGSSGMALEYAAEELRADRSIVIAAVERNGQALQFATTELRSDREIALAAVLCCPAAFRHVAQPLMDDRGFLLEAAAADRSGELLRFVSAELRQDRDFVIAAVRGNWRAYKLAPPNMQADAEVVNAAAMQNLEAMRYVVATAGLRANVPTSMMELCRGKDGEFGSRILLNEEFRACGRSRGPGRLGGGSGPKVPSAYSGTLQKGPSPLSVRTSDLRECTRQPQCTGWVQSTPRRGATPTDRRVLIHGGLRVLTCTRPDRAKSCEVTARPQCPGHGRHPSDIRRQRAPT